MQGEGRERREQRERRELPKELHPKLYNAFEYLCEKWENFRYDKVTRVKKIRVNGEESIYYVHEWVDPPTKSFRDYVIDTFIPKVKLLEIGEATDATVSMHLSTACYWYRYDSCIKHEHSEITPMNPRENGDVDESRVIEESSTRLPPTRVPAMRSVLDYTEYWLL